MYSIENVQSIDVENISEYEVRLMVHDLMINNQTYEFKALSNVPGIKQKMNIGKYFKEICLYGNCEVLDYILFSPEFKPESDVLELDDKRFVFGSFCKAGDIPRAIKVYNSVDIPQEELNRSLQLACIFNKLEVVRFLLNGQTIKQKADIHYQSETALNNACREGHLEIVKYLIESPEIEDHANLHLELHGGTDYPFVLASEYSRDEVVKYLMKVEGKNKPDISASDYGVIKQYVLSGNLEMVKHIIEEENIDIHLDEDYLFNAATKREHYHIVQYLLLEKNIEITEDIIKNLQQNSNQIVEEMIKKRDLHEKMQNKFMSETESRKELYIKKI